MKKRKILVSLALASACLFSLASCGKDEASTTTTTAPAQTTTTTAAPTTTTTTAPAQTTTTTTAPAQTTTTTGAQTTTTTTTSATTEYDVKYYAVYSDGTDEEQLTDLNCKVAKNGKANQPTAPTKTGYEFRGFKNYNTEEPFDFANTGITKNTKIAVFYYKPTAYDTMAASTNTNKVFATDFSDKTPQTSIAAYSADAGVYNEKDADAEKNGADYSINNYQTALKTYDKGSAQTKVNVNFGSEIENSKVKILTTFQLDGTVVAGSWPFIEISEKKTDGTNMVIGFGYNGEKKIGYRIGDNYYQLKDAAFEAGVSYELIIEIDTNAGTAKFTLDNEELGTANVSCENISGMKFVTGGSAGTYDSHTDERTIIVKNIAVEAVANSVDAVKTAAKADIQALYDAYEDSDKATGFDTIWTNFVDAAKTSADSAIEAATTVAEVKAAKEDGLAAIETLIKALRTQYIGTIGFDSLPQWSYANNASTSKKESYESSSSTEKQEYDDALAELKAKYIDTTTYVEACIPADRFDVSKGKLYVKDGDNYVALESTATYDATATYYIKLQLKYKKGETLVPNTVVTTLKELLECYNQFVADAEDIVAEKVDVTVKYVSRAFTEATGLTEFATGVDYYTLDDVYAPKQLAPFEAFETGVTYYTKSGDVYTAVAAGATFDSTITYYVKTQNYVKKADTVTTPAAGVTYYTLGYTKAGDDASFKVVQNGTTSFATLPALTNKVLVSAYSDEACKTDFDFTAGIASNTTIYVVVGERIVFINPSSLTGNQSGDTTHTKFGPDKSKVVLGTGVIYSAKNNAVLTASNIADLTIEGEDVTKFLDTNGRSDANKGWFEIDTTAYAGKRVAISVYLTSSANDSTREIWATTLPTDIGDATKKENAQNKKIASATVAGSKTEMTEFVVDLDAGNAYIIVDNKVYIYAISVVVY